MFAHLRIIKNEEEARREMEAIGVEGGGTEIMVPKSFHHCIKFYGLEPQDAIILKQEMLAAGGDVAISQYAIPPHGKMTDALVIGTETQLRILSRKMKMQYERLNEAGEKILEIMENIGRRHELVMGKKFELGKRTLIMGILNVTPDSFYDGGRYARVEDAVARAKEMVDEGADIIDVGGESTRPGSIPVSGEEEMKRVLPVIKAISDELDVPVSVDTYRAEVAEEAIKAGAKMVNDVTALRGDDNMANIIGEYGVPVCLMHMKGTPQNMQKNPHYDDVMAEITKFLHERAGYAMSHGIDGKNIILDPGSTPTRVERPWVSAAGRCIAKDLHRKHMQCRGGRAVRGESWCGGDGDSERRRHTEGARREGDKKDGNGCRQNRQIGTKGNYLILTIFPCPGITKSAFSRRFLLLFTTSSMLYAKGSGRCSIFSLSGNAHHIKSPATEYVFPPM